MEGEGDTVMKKIKVFLLLEDDTIKSISCKYFSPPDKYNGKKVLAASTYLADFDFLRILFGEKYPTQRILELKVPFFVGGNKKGAIKMPPKQNRRYLKKAF